MTIFNKYPMRILAISVLIFTSGCAEKKEAKQEKEQIKKEVKSPKGIISLAEANAIYNNYSEHRVSIIENYEIDQRAPEEAFEAGRFVDFDYQTIKDYIAFVDQEATKAGVEKVTNLRLYFANYPNEERFPNGDKVIHKRQNSIFIVPTMESNGGNYGFYIGKDGKAELISNWSETNKLGLKVNTATQNNKAYASTLPSIGLNSSLQGGSSLALNRGNGGPPPKTDF